MKYFTKKGLEKLKKELDYSKKVKRKEIAERIREAASFGDRSENFAYQQAKEDQAFLEGRILELENIIRQAKIIEKKDVENIKEVQIGSFIAVNSGNNERKEFQIVGPEEANPFEGKISFQSPLGKSLLGKMVGQKIEVETPTGKVKYEILKID